MMNWEILQKDRRVQLAVAWFGLPLVMFGVAFAITPLTVLFCSLGNPLFELAVDTLQIAIRSDAVSRCFFGIVFIYCHMLLPTGIYYLRKDRRVSVAVLSIWCMLVATTVLKAAGYVNGKS